MASTSTGAEQRPGHGTAAAHENGDEPKALVRLLDFAQPTKFTIEIRRHISAALAECCDTLAASLAAELKVDVEFELGEVAQHTWAAARSHLPADAVAAAVEPEGTETMLLLSAELPWTLQALECLLGGHAASAPPARRLTDLDRALLQGLLDTVVGELSVAWTGLGGPSLRSGEIDLEGDAGVLIAPGEPTLSVTLASRIDGAAAAITLLLPWLTVAPILGRRQDRHERARSPQAVRDAERLRRGLAVAPVLLRAEVGSTQIPAERVLDLAPGGLLTLDEKAADGVRIYADDVCLGCGKPGRSESRRAVKLLLTGQSRERAQTYARLGRTDLERARSWVDGEQGGERPEILRSIFVRLWVELGRTHVSLGEATELGVGAIIELDQEADAPVEVFANGLCLARGSLAVTPTGAWGVRIESIV